MKQLLFLLLFVIASSAIAQTGTASTLTLQHDNKTREYIVYVPQVYDGQSEVPLVINLHGYGSSMTEQIVYGDFRKIADTANFILVVPNGLKDASNIQHWNYYLSNGEDDLGFLSALIDELTNNYAINSQRVYSTGMSNGGFMSIHLGCELAPKITAVASVTGTMIINQTNNCNPTKPMPTLLIHGTNDAVVPYDGNATMISVSDVLSHWINQTNASTTPIVTPVPDIDNTDNCTAEHYLYSDGTNGATVEHYKIIGGGHTWPGSVVDINAGPTNQDFDASTEIWRFFSQYDSEELLNTKEESTLANTLNIYPNPSKGVLRFETDQAIESLVITNIQGKVIKKQNNIQQPLTISNIDSGVYFIKCKIGENTITKKVVVRK